MENNTEEEKKGFSFKFIDLKYILKTIGFIFIIILLFYILLIIGGRKIQMDSTFPRTGVKLEDIDWYEEYNLDFEEINISDPDGYNINGLYVGSGTGKTVYYFHGNGGSLGLFYNEIDYINKLGYNVLAYDYPGYGKSEGFPYKNNIDTFSQEFYNYVKDEKNINDEDLIVWGYSIGTAIATDFASKNDFEKLILISPLSSRYDMSEYFFNFPLQKYLFLEDSYVTKDLVKNFEQDILILHGNDDSIIPFGQGLKVFENYLGDKKFIEIDGFGHNGIISTYGDSLKNIFIDFINGEDLGFTDNYFILTEEEKESLEFKSLLDLETDDSIQKFVSADISFDDVSYIPEGLESIGSDFVYDTKGGYQTLRGEANVALQKLSEEFYNKFGVKMSVVSAYRSYAYQKGIKDRGCPDNLCAKAGYSEHQSGLAVDIFEASSEDSWMNNSKLTSYFNWMGENAVNYGFHNTYQKGLDIDTYEIEPWHWRYMGVELSTYLKENNLTIAEYYNNSFSINLD